MWREALEFSLLSIILIPFKRRVKILFLRCLFYFFYADEDFLLVLRTSTGGERCPTTISSILLNFHTPLKKHFNWPCWYLTTVPHSLLAGDLEGHAHPCLGKKAHVLKWKRTTTKSRPWHQIQGILCMSLAPCLVMAASTFWLSWRRRLAVTHKVVWGWMNSLRFDYRKWNLFFSTTRQGSR